MEKNYFEIICESVNNEVIGKEFECKKSENDCTFKKNNDDYKIVYDGEKQVVYLKKVSAKGEYKNVSAWSVSTESFTQKDVEMISKDFVQTITGYENKTNNKQVRAKSNDQDDNTVDSLIFANRMASIFPEIKEDVRIEKECYSQFRGAMFTKEKVLPLINDLLSSGKNKNKAQKLFKVISELYENGNLDVRSIITMVILNGIKGEKEINLAEQMVSDKLKKAWQAASKYKGKKVKPEKIKKKSNFLSKTLLDN